MTDAKYVKRERRIVIYTKVGILILAVLAAFSNHPEFLGAVIVLGLMLGIKFFIFNFTRYPYVYLKYKRGECPVFPLIQAGILLAIMVAVLLFLFGYMKAYRIIVG